MAKLNIRTKYEFIDLDRVEPHKHAKEARRHEFIEIYDPYEKEQGESQSERCTACGNPYCQWKCLVHNYIPDWLKLASEGRIIEVAIIGPGPAGLSCADVLARNGVKAVVYDKRPEIGGLLSFGIPEFKLEHKTIKTRRNILEGMGIKFVLGADIGEEISFKEVLDNHDAVFLGLGTYTPLQGAIPGEQVAGVYPALDYLIGNTKSLLNMPGGEHGFIDLKGQRVVVLGGGDTAMDCVRTAIRQGAREVHCLYRRDRHNMPGLQHEVSNAVEEGVQFGFNVQPLEIIEENGQAVRVIETRPGEADESGRHRPEPIDGSECDVKADAVIVAYGFRASPASWLEDFDISTNQWGLVEANASDQYAFQTSNPKIFAAGDMVRAADLVVTAVADARKATDGIANYLSK